MPPGRRGDGRGPGGGRSRWARGRVRRQRQRVADKRVGDGFGRPVASAEGGLSGDEGEEHQVLAAREYRGRRLPRPLAADREPYRGRNVVERCVNRLKQWRAVATRYEKRAATDRATVVAALLMWLGA